MQRKRRDPIDPSKTMAYNHYKVDGDKPVISNQMFKNAYESDNPFFMQEVMNIYACDSTQKHLLKTKISKLLK